jgi:hypothetical protein
MASAAAETLLHGLVDYAGLFPPAALPMAQAVRLYDEYRRGAHAWILGRFVLPVARLEEFVRHAAPLFGRGVPWRLSVVGGADDRETIERFNEKFGERAVIDALEGKAATVDEVGQHAALASLRTSQDEPFFVFVEVPIAEDTAALVSAIGANSLRAKVRTGGVTTEAFPAAVQLTRFLWSCATSDVAFKATAGLHHPMRGDYRLTYESGSPQAAMFGFLNVFLAACFLRAGLSEDRVVAVLEERDPKAFEFEPGRVLWGGHQLDAHSIDALRERFATSFGSCSFAEPVQELISMELL